MTEILTTVFYMRETGFMEFPKTISLEGDEREEFSSINEQIAALNLGLA